MDSHCDSGLFCDNKDANPSNPSFTCKASPNNGWQWSALGLTALHYLLLRYCKDFRAGYGLYPSSKAGIIYNLGAVLHCLLAGLHR